MSEPVERPGPTGPQTAAREVNWQDFREHLATAHKDGRRRWVYAKQPAGKWY